MSQCPNCGVRVDDRATVCERCGASLAPGDQPHQSPGEGRTTNTPDDARQGGTRTPQQGGGHREQPRSQQGQHAERGWPEQTQQGQQGRQAAPAGDPHGRPGGQTGGDGGGPSRRELLTYGGGAALLLGGGSVAFLLTRDGGSDEQATDGYGEQVAQTAPQLSTQFEYDAESDVLSITHEGGATVEAGALRIRGTGSPDLGDTWDEYDSSVSPSSDVMAGDTIQVESVAGDATVRVVWEGPSGDESAVLEDWTGPDA